mmetsp:Transcript_55699/g.121992  ORF Transcript_55699/g.121992 Transcript_55699/m.121992 type:complete len:336 (+) Transcript_55699:2466-3473(+)
MRSLHLPHLPLPGRGPRHRASTARAGCLWAWQLREQTLVLQQVATDPWVQGLAGVRRHPGHPLEAVQGGGPEAGGDGGGRGVFRAELVDFGVVRPPAAQMQGQARRRLYAGDLLLLLLRANSQTSSAHVSPDEATAPIHLQSTLVLPEADGVVVPSGWGVGGGLGNGVEEGAQLVAPEPFTDSKRHGGGFPPLVAGGVLRFSRICFSSSITPERVTIIQLQLTAPIRALAAISTVLNFSRTIITPERFKIMQRLIVDPIIRLTNGIHIRLSLAAIIEAGCIIAFTCSRNHHCRKFSRIMIIPVRVTITLLRLTAPISTVPGWHATFRFLQRLRCQ